MSFNSKEPDGNTYDHRDVFDSDYLYHRAKLSTMNTNGEQTPASPTGTPKSNSELSSE